MTNLYLSMIQISIQVTHKVVKSGSNPPEHEGGSNHQSTKVITINDIYIRITAVYKH